MSECVSTAIYFSDVKIYGLREIFILFIEHDTTSLNIPYLWNDVINYCWSLCIFIALHSLEPAESYIMEIFSVSNINADGLSVQM